MMYLRRLYRYTPILALVLLLSGCSADMAGNNGSGKNMTYVQWEDSWEKAPYAGLYRYPWDNMKKLTVEYTYRTCPQGIKREKQGNVYLEGWPLVDEKVTLKGFAPLSPIMEDFENNFVLNNLEKKTNIHIEWTLVPKENLKEKRDIVLAGGSYPDFFMGCWFSKTDELIYGSQQGILLPVEELIESYGYWYKRNFEVRKEDKKSLTAPDGHIYSLPSIFFNYWTKYPNRAYINSEWLANLNLKIPESAEEFYNVMKAFKTQDPNKNGVNDEIPLAFCKDSNGTSGNLLNFFVSPYIVMNSSASAGSLVVEDGIVSFVPVREEYRNALRWIKKMYDEELVTSESFTQTSEQLKQMMETGKDNIVGCVPYLQHAEFLNGDVTNPKFKIYEMMAPLKGPSGKGYTYFQTGGQYINGTLVFTNALQYPALAMRWADWWASPEGTFAAWYGRLGEEWEYASEGDTNMTGSGQAVWRMIKDKTYTPNNVLVNELWPPSCEPLEELFVSRAADSTENYIDAYMIKETKKKYESRRMMEYYPDVLFPPTVEEGQELSQLNIVLNEYVNQAAVKFIMDRMSLDSDWEDYIRQLENLGYKRKLEIDQKAYDIYIKH